MREQKVIQLIKGQFSALFGNKSKAAEPASEFARIREDRRAALTAFKAAIDARDTRLQRSTQLLAIQATNAALRGGR